MQNTRTLTPDITWVGGSDRRLALFENLFPLPDGITYNAYLIRDEKTALLDTVDNAISRQFIENLLYALDGRALDYLVINHMEPDHCANIVEIRRLFPDVTLVGNAKTLQLLGQFYGMDTDAQQGTLTVKEGDTLSLGKHTLQFLMAPMVHWPEVMFTYEVSEGLLFSADAFGTFGDFDGSLFSDEMAYEQRMMQEARRYYGNIVGKYGPQVQAVLRKVAPLTVNMICPLHGPVLRGADIALMLDKYQKWSTYTPEDQGVLIAYGSMYGNTENAANILAGLLSQKGVRDVRVYDVSKTHYATIVAEGFRLSHWMFAAPTYNMGLFGAMHTLLHDMQALNMQNRHVSIIGNGSWAPASHTIMQQMTGEMKGMQAVGDPLLLKTSVTEADMAQLGALADAIVASLTSQ